MKVFVCGGSGLLGRTLCLKLGKSSIEYVASYNSNFIENGIKLNFLNLNEINDVFNKYHPTICINCIVERQVDKCEKDWENTKKINIDIPNNLAKICSKYDIPLIHISTDYVFDGLNPPYFPDSLTNPLQNYGISKLISENKIISKCKKYTIIRVPVLFSDNLKNLEENAVTLIGKKVLNRVETFYEDNYSIRRPNYILDFCEFIIDMINNPKVGIFHYYNPFEKKTKYEISQILVKYLNKKNNIVPINIEPEDGVERPKDTELKDNKYNIYDYTFSPLKDTLEKCYEKLYHPNITNIEEHKNLFFLIDLDGTLIDTDSLHYKCYNESFFKFLNIDMTYDNYLHILNTIGIDKYLEENYPNVKKDIKELKNTLLKSQNIKFMKNAEKFLEYIIDKSINYCIVTNTSKKNVEYFKSKLPLLSKLKNWIVREDYNYPKPSSECYKKAFDLYYNNEKYIVGIENSLQGYNSLKKVTECIYIFIEKSDIYYNFFKSQDVYLINDYDDFFNVY